MPDTPAASMPYTVFISHAHADNEFTKELAAALRQAGADVWYDMENLGPGVLLRPTIMRELNDRRIFLTERHGWARRMRCES